MQNILSLQQIIASHANGCMTGGEKFRSLISEIINPSCVTDERMVYLAVCWLRDNSFPLVNELQLHIQYKYGIDLFQLVGKM